MRRKIQVKNIVENNAFQRLPLGKRMFPITQVTANNDRMGI